MDFNLQRYFELIRKSKELFDQGKLLWNYDKLENEELVRYQMMLADDIFWQSRKQYLQTIEAFLSQKITVEEFIQEFDHLRGLNRQALERKEKNLETKNNLQLDPKSFGFTSIISSLARTINLFDPEIKEDKPELVGYGISEQLLRFSIKKRFLSKIREYQYCKES